MKALDLTIRSLRNSKKQMMSMHNQFMFIGIQ
ncbi:MAG TPA: hypothetical protein [Caudoviricetes sp.]|nr:MAG TPA: hypothetical protein [Caudoviricetes sp.]